MRFVYVIMAAVLLFPACSGKKGPSLSHEDLNAGTDQGGPGEVHVGDTMTDARPDCGKCPWNRTCSPEGKCVPYPCESSKDCPAGDLVCNQEAGECVQCVGPEDCPAELFCGADHRCHETYPCQSDKDCKDYDLVCDKEAGKCVECLTALECLEAEYCEQGFCLAAACAIGASKCVGNALHACPEGRAWVIAQTCTEQQYCEEGECMDLACNPEEGWCDGNIYKLCSEDGKSVQLEEDCEASGKKCSSLGCGECKAQCQQKECGNDGCGGSCGACGGDENCVAGNCAAKCGDGECTVTDEESCESCPTDCGECPGACTPACDADREECLQATTGDWVCAARPVVIPAGEFWMGCSFCDGPPIVEEATCNFEELPYHLVYLDEYSVGRTEVTQSQYSACASAGACEPAGTEDPLCVWGKPDMGDYPINCVGMDQARDYCDWLGGGLCTEAQWEKTARGGCEENGGPTVCKSQNRIYPWGNEPAPNCSLVAMDGCDSKLKPACSLSPAGDSPYGVCDLLGNVWEHIADTYGSDFYCKGQFADISKPGEHCPECSEWPGAPDAWQNPSFKGPSEFWNLRGGSYKGLLHITLYRRARHKAIIFPPVYPPFYGFRCCISE
jgi:formylglycine-generating enzyme required for sulfatase activity